jgi:hypothetical protein
MATSAGQRNEPGREWQLPLQARRRGNAAGRLPDGRPDGAPPTGTQRRITAAERHRAAGPADAETGKPALPAIIAAVEELREDLPRAGVGALYLQFRCRGGRWALVTLEDVRVALAGIERAARREFLPPAGTDSSRRPVPRTPHGFWPEFQRAVAELSDRGIDVAGSVRLLHDTGWRQVGPDDVIRARRRLKAVNTPGHFLPGRSLPTPRQAAPGLCPACEVPVTDLGLCRCS